MKEKSGVDRSFNKILTVVEKYYSEKIETHGATAKGVDWNSPESQALRFKQLLKVCDKAISFSINDYGCGYGALAQYMANRNYAFLYYGFDISDRMITKARELHNVLGNCKFFSNVSLLPMADYTVASGLFNVRLQTSDEDWKNYMLQSIDKIAEISKRGFAFNALTKYSDPDRLRPDLYYADPCFLFDYCKVKLSRHVSLLHDYGLYEFTILVRK